MIKLAHSQPGLNQTGQVAFLSRPFRNRILGAREAETAHAQDSRNLKWLPRRRRLRISRFTEQSKRMNGFEHSTSQPVSQSERNYIVRRI